MEPHQGYQLHRPLRDVAPQRDTAQPHACQPGQQSTGCPLRCAVAIGVNKVATLAEAAAQGYAATHMDSLTKKLPAGISPAWLEAIIAGAFEDGFKAAT